MSDNAFVEKSDRIALSLLHAYFPVVSTLQEYLETILDDQGFCLQASTPSHPPAFTELLETSYVTATRHLDDVKRLTPIPPMSHMQEVSGMIRITIRYCIFKLLFDTRS